MEESLDELAELARSAGAEVLERVVQTRPAPEAATLIGQGKVEELAALAGYTNAGKSTLFNRLTSAGVLADARMFATLDPTVRPLVLPSRRRVLLSDTVGFIRNLPTQVVEAFRATLEEVNEAALVLHVVDVTSPSAKDHTTHVLKVLAEIGAAAIPQILILKIGRAHV